MALFRCGTGGTPELVYKGNIVGQMSGVIHSDLIPPSYKKLICVFAGKVSSRGAKCTIYGSQNKTNLVTLTEETKSNNHCETIIVDYYPYISAGYSNWSADGTYGYSSLVVYGVK